MGTRRVAIGATAASVLVLGACELGAASTTYQPVTDLDPESTGATVVGVAPGDVDGDGDVDLVATGHNYAFGVLLNDGDGTFTVGAYSGGYDSYYRLSDPRLADVNGDGVLDLVVYQSYDTVIDSILLFLGDGAGAFTFTETLSVGTEVGVSDMQVADVTGDGLADIVVSGADRLLVWPRLPGGGLGERVATTGVDRGLIGVGDLDGDGRADVVTATTGGSTVVDEVTPWLAAADGTFTAGTPVAVDDPSGARLSPTLAVGDVDADGDADVVASTDGRLLTVPGDGAGGLGAPIATPLASDHPGALTLADLDDDGLLDVAAADRRPNRAGFVAFGDGAGGFEDRMGVAMPKGAFPARSLLATDVAGDDRPDLVLPGYGVRVAPNALDGRTRP